MRTATAILISLCMLLLASGCKSAAYATIETDQVNPKFKGGPGQKILVIVVSADKAMREDVETQYGIAAAEMGLSLTASHRVIPGNVKDVTKEQLLELVKAQSFDRVLLVRTIPGSATTGKHTNYVDYYSEIMPPVNFYDGWSNTVVVAFSPTDPPPSFGRYVTLRVETLFYDASDASVIWNSISKVTTSEHAGDAGAAYARTILKRLGKAGLL